MNTPTRPAVATRALAAGVWLTFVASIASSFAVRAVDGTHLWDPIVIPFTAFATVGWIVASRNPRAPVGWLFLAIGVLASLGVVTDAIVGLALHRGWSCTGIVMLSAWVQMWFWYPLLVLSTAYTLLLFPSGLPSRRWRPVVWVLSAMLVAMVVTAALTPTVDFGKAKVHNPIGLGIDATNIESTPVFNVAGLVIGACLVAAVVSLGIRFRRSGGIERAQLKWFLLGAAGLGAFVIASLFSPSFNHSTANNVLAPIAMSLPPLACGFAITRYRLYDIDRIVSRTVSYALVTGVILAMYVGAVALTQRVLSFASSFAVAASTLAVAAAFQPMRRRIQTVVDRRFDRAAYDAGRTVDTFSARLRDQVDVDTVRGHLLSTVSAAVSPTVTSLWVAPRPVQEKAPA
jgi:hypothetical protein